MEDSFDLRAEEGSRSAGDEPSHEDVHTRVSQDNILNEAALATANSALNHPGMMLSSSNDALVQRELLSRAVALNESSLVGSLQVQQNEIVRVAAGLTNANPPLYHLESRMQQLQGQLDRQQALPSLLHQEPTVGSLDLRQIRPSNLLLNMQSQIRMDQGWLQEQQQQQLQSRLGLTGMYLPVGSLWSPSPSSLAMMSQLGSQTNPSLLIQDNALLADPSTSLVPSYVATLHRNLSSAAAPAQGLDLLQTSQARLHHAGGGARESTFPMKLHRILADPSCHDCICWLPSGKSWRVLNQHVLAQVVLPEYFNHQKYASFMRQVNGWGFKRTMQGPAINSYSHELFVRSNPELCLKMRRLKQSQRAENQQDTR